MTHVSDLNIKCCGAISQKRKNTNKKSYLKG